MDPIAKFLNIFFYKIDEKRRYHKYTKKEGSFIDIFNDGVTFFEFICEILGIPLRNNYLTTNSDSKPDDKYAFNLNNLRALKLLTLNYPGIIDITKPYETEKDICELFKIIITKIIFNINTTKIFNICKRIFSKYQITIKKEEDLLNKENFMTLIYLLYYHKKPKDDEINIQDFDNFIQKIIFTKQRLIFEVDNAESCKHFIDSSFFDEKYDFLVYIQIHAIFIFLGYEFYETPLHLAIKFNNMKIIKLLLARPELDVNLQNILLGRYFKLFCYLYNYNIACSNHLIKKKYSNIKLSFHLFYYILIKFHHYNIYIL